MGQVAAPGRARPFADLAFSLLAAGLGLALLVATGRHLFGAPSLDRPDRTLAPLTAAAVVPAPGRVTLTGARANGSTAIPVSNVIPARPILTRAANLPLVSGEVAGASQRLHRTVGVTKAASQRPHATVGVTKAASQRPRATVGVTKAASGQPRATVGVGNAASPIEKSRVKAITRPPRGALPARPRQVSGFVARRITIPHPAWPAFGARRSHGIATPQSGVRVAGAFARGHIVRRLPAAPEPSIIEPPLGYEARPTLVLVPGAARLELGESVIPTIRSRRRH